MTLRPILLLLAALAAISLLLPRAQAADPALTFEYTLDNRYQTSAGVYDAAGRLIRTLWSNRTREQGSHTGSWDGLDDFGQPWNGEGEVEVKLLAHNVNYRWEGVIGNTSKDQTSPMKLDYQYFMRDFEVSGERIYTIHASEGWIPDLRYHLTSDLNADWAPSPGLENVRGAFNYFSHIASDGERVYAARMGFDREDPANGIHASFIVVLDRDLLAETPLPASREFCAGGRSTYRSFQDCYRDGRTSAAYTSAIDVVDRFRGKDVALNSVTGLAVQHSGRFLFASRGGLDQLRVIDKRTGQLMHEAQLEGAGELATCKRDSGASVNAFLWAIHGNGGGQRRVVSRLSVEESTGIVSSSTVLTLAEEMVPLNLALSPDCTEVAVVAGGARQQVLGFDAGSGALRWVLGEPGGHRVSTQVSPKRFSFTDRFDAKTRNVSEFGFVDYSPNGDLFVGDAGLTRVQRFDARREALVDAAMWAPLHYNIRVDQNDSTRVFRGFHEYTLDYTRPLSESWRLVRYYGDALRAAYPAVHLEGSTDSGFSSIATLANGRSYGLAPNGANRQLELIELPKQGMPVLLGVRLPPFHFMRADGAIESVRYGRVGERFVDFTERALSGVSVDGRLRWRRPVVVARALRRPVDPRVNHYFGAARITGTFGNGLRLLFDPKPAGKGAFHLAAAKPGDDQWMWRASRETGPFQLNDPDGRFDSAEAWYSAMAVTVLGEHAVYAYHGEGWPSDIHGGGAPSQANQFLHFHQSGLFIGQFGTPGQPDIPPQAPGSAGNAFSVQLVDADRALYFLHNTENAHSGIHLWRVNGAEHLHTWSGRGARYARLALAHMNGSGPTVMHRKVPRPGRMSGKSSGSRIQLDWEAAGTGVTEVEVERLSTTYTGRRFERVARLPASATAWTDTSPELGAPVTYRARFMNGNAAGDYSRHVTLEVPFRREPIYAEDFEGSEWARLGGQLPHWTCAGSEPPGERCGPVESRADGRVFALSVTAPAGKGFRLERGWLAQPLLKAFNSAMARPRGSNPAQFEVSFDYWLPPFPREGTLEGRLEIEPGGGMHTFARLGGLFRLKPVGNLDSSTGLVKGRARQVLTALPNGRREYGVVHFVFNEAPRMHVLVGFHGQGIEPGRPLEIRVDNFRVERLVPLNPEARQMFSRHLIINR